MHLSAGVTLWSHCILKTKKKEESLYPAYNVMMRLGVGRCTAPLYRRALMAFEIPHGHGGRQIGSFILCFAKMKMKIECASIHCGELCQMEHGYK